jgi:signal peptidase I
MGKRTYGIKNNVAAMSARTEDQEVSSSNLMGQSSGRWRSLFASRYWLRDSILATLLGLIFIVFLYQPVQIEGNSMLPRLENHERIFVNRLVYRLEPIHRDDIIVFRYPLDPHKYFIKRVIGLPGEWVSIKDGKVYIDGKPLRESYIPRSDLGDENAPPVYVPRDHYYVLGDHRGFSDDSRTWGTLDQRLIYGKAVFAYWPLSQIGPLG